MPFLQCVGDLSSAFDNFVVNSVRKNIFFLPIIQFYLPINTNKPHFVVVLVFVGKAHSFVLKMSSLEIFAKRDAILTPVLKQWIARGILSLI